MHAYVVLFVWVFAEQVGLPLPSAPLLLMAGTLTATHRLQLLPVLASILSGSMLSDVLWYFLGKRYGHAVVRMLCHFAPHRDTCVDRMEGYFTRHGSGTLLISKFLPALNTMAGAIAGQTGMSFRLFLLYDAGGVLLWALSFVVGGRFFGDLLKMHPHALAWVAHFAVGLFVLLFVGFLYNRTRRRRRSLAEIRTDRVTPSELHTMLEANEPLYLVDLRHPLDYLPDPRTLPGAAVMTPDRLVELSNTIPRDRDVVLFCTCPNEETAVRMALAIRKMGVSRVRPLLGGFDGWKNLGYPLVPIPESAGLRADAEAV
ncbi:VTT domain-containing protein [Acidipila sp. EB88]|uniref:VTT domain-containing protein n=1 Tax=Acidipila sp. EB88 TaxID=2305226 RepID=UPI001F1FDD4F|nr:VTT domain-containing protein [Acidipila sp. EB88]